MCPYSTFWVNRCPNFYPSEHFCPKEIKFAENTVFYITFKWMKNKYKQRKANRNLPHTLHHSPTSSVMRAPDLASITEAQFKFPSTPEGGQEKVLKPHVSLFYSLHPFPFSPRLHNWSLQAHMKRIKYC